MIRGKDGGAEKDGVGGTSKTTDGSPIPDPNQSKTRGRNFWTKKAAKSKTKGAKSRTWGVKQTGSESSQQGSPGIRTFFSPIRRPEEAKTPMGRPENVFGNDLKNDSLSVHDRPANKTNVFYD